MSTDHKHFFPKEFIKTVTTRESKKAKMLDRGSVSSSGKKQQLQRIIENEGDDQPRQEGMLMRFDIDDERDHRVEAAPELAEVPRQSIHSRLGRHSEYMQSRVGDNMNLVDDERVPHDDNNMLSGGLEQASLAPPQTRFNRFTELDSQAVLRAQVSDEMSPISPAQSNVPPVNAMVQPLNLLSQPDNKSLRGVSPSNSAVEEEEHKEPEPRVVRPVDIEDSLNPKSQRY